LEVSFGGIHACEGVFSTIPGSIPAAEESPNPICISNRTLAMKHTSGIFALLILLLTLAAPSVQAQINPNISWKLLTPTLTGKPGSTVYVRVQATIAPKSHLYTQLAYPSGVMGPLPLEVTVGDEHLSSSGKIQGPTPNKHSDANFEVETEYWEGTITLTVPVKIARNARGHLDGWVNFYFMTCDDKSCQIPTDQKLRFTVKCRK
jgi:hypothetical protein